MTDGGRTRRAWRVGSLLLAVAVGLALVVVASDLLALSAAAAVMVVDTLVEVGVPLLSVGLLLGIVVRVLRGRRL